MSTSTSTTQEQLQGSWNYPTAIRFGAGRIQELPQACRELGITRPLLVTDADLAKLPIVDDVLQINREAGLATEVFSAIRPNPNGDNVNDGVLAFRGGKHDGVIAFGGGSALDAGKAVALMAGQTRPLWDFEDVEDWYTRVDEKGMAPVVAVPTTSGTGSEVGRASVILDEAAQKKKIIFHPKMLPARVICDPVLTTGMPPALTAAVGMDALSHSLEAFCSPLFHPMAHGIAAEGIRLVHLALRAAVADGHDLVARARMMAASTMGATAFQRGLGAMHAVSHAVGARYDTHHGRTIGVMMPYVLKFNREAIAERMDQLARYLGLDIELSGGTGFEAVQQWVLALRRDLGIPHELARLGVSADHVPDLAAAAADDASGGTNPVPLSVESLKRIIEAAVAGEL